MGFIGHANPARFGNTFKPSGNVDAVAKDVVVVDDDIADMDAEPEFNSHILRDVGVLRGHRALDLNRATGCIDGAGEFHKHAVTGRLDDAATVGSYSRVNKSFSGRLESGQCAFLVGTHEATISSDICRQHSRQSPFYPVARQRSPQVAITDLSKHVGLFVG